MTQIKRIMTLLLAGVLAISTMLTSCNTDVNPDETEKTDGESKQEEIVEEPYEEVFTYETENGTIEYSSEVGKIAEYPALKALEIAEDTVTYVDDEYFAALDAKANAMRDKILNTETTIVPEGDAKEYYVSMTGDDSADGETPETAWKTLGNVSGSENLNAGDVIYFERGGVWRGQLQTMPGVTYTAYGDVANGKPALYGSPEDGADAKKWALVFEDKLTGKKIWQYQNKLMDSGTLVFNHGEAGCAYKEVPNYIDGKYMLRRNNSVEFDYTVELDNDLEMFQAADSEIKNGVPNVGSVNNVGYIYLRCDSGNPGEVFDSIEFLPRRNGFQVGGNEGVTIDNFCIKYVGSHGVGAGTCKDLTITNCELAWIGGGIQTYQFRGDTTGRVTRYGNAIEIYGGCDGYVVDNCYIWQAYDAGVTHQVGVSDGPKVYYMNDIYYTNNLIEYCTYNVEYFLSGVPQDNPSMMNNVNISDNIMRYAGNGWGEQRPDTGSAAHIKSWSSSNPATDFVIERNIFDRGYHRLFHIASTLEEHLPIMRDNVYIQYNGAKLGMFGPGSPKDQVYDENVAALINEGYIKDVTADIRYARPEPGMAVFEPTSEYDDYLDSLPSYSYVDSNGTLIPFRVVYPASYTKGDKLPMVVVLHNEYQNGSENREQARLNADLARSAYKLWAGSSANCIFLFPQCRDGYKWVNTKLAATYSMDEVGESRHLKAVAELIPVAAEYFGADTTNISVSGTSEGATAAWDIAMRHPELFSRAMMVCGAVDPTHAEALGNMEVYVFHGTNDVKVRIAGVDAAIEQMKSAGANITYNQVEGAMHDCWKQVQTGDAVKKLVG